MTILALVVVLGVLIFVHELGHFAAAKAVGIGVERFSIGLGPRIWGVTHGETEYVLSAIPLGGYVKMVGMDDEVMERMEGGRSEEPRVPTGKDYDSKPVWARAIVISAGVIMNMLFAWFAYTTVMAVWGYAEVAELRVGEVAAERLPQGTEALAGIPAGARLVRIGTEELAHWGDVRDALLEGESGPVEVVTAAPDLRFTIDLPADSVDRLLLATAVSAWADPLVGGVEPGSPADEGGLESGDRVLAVEGQEIVTWQDVVRTVRARPEMATELTLERDGGELTRTVTPQSVVEEDPVTGERMEIGRIGIAIPLRDAVYERVSLGEAVVYGWRETVAATRLILGFLRDLVTGGVSPRSMGSIITIGQASGQAASAGMDVFLRFMALFSVNLAVLNLLPIPILDGGHLVFLAIEAVRGRALSVEQRIRWSNVGFLIVMGIMVWALGNDLLRVFGL
ncbi:MAG: RIP metalloprotease RseP [Gemmatimonadota bacterium]